MSGESVLRNVLAEAAVAAARATLRTEPGSDRYWLDMTIEQIEEGMAARKGTPEAEAVLVAVAGLLGWEATEVGGDRVGDRWCPAFVLSAKDDEQGGGS